MCLGVPMQVTDVDGLSARCAGPKGEEAVSLALVGPVAPGAHLLVHLGSAIRVVEADEARQIADALRALDAAMAGQPFDHLIADLIDREPQLPAHLRPAEKPAENKNDNRGQPQSDRVEDTNEPSPARQPQDA